MPVDDMKSPHSRGRGGFLQTNMAPHLTDALKRVPTFTRAKALRVWMVEPSLASTGPYARFSGLYSPVGTRFSASVCNNAPHTPPKKPLGELCCTSSFLPKLCRLSL